MFLTLGHHCCRRRRLHCCRQRRQPPSQGSLRGCLRLLCLQKPNRLPSLVLSFSPLHNWQTVSFSAKASLPALASSEMVRKKDINDIFRFLRSPGQARNCNPFLHNVRFLGIWKKIAKCVIVVNQVCIYCIPPNCTFSWFCLEEHNLSVSKNHSSIISMICEKNLKLKIIFSLYRHWETK